MIYFSKMTSLFILFTLMARPAFGQDDAGFDPYQDYKEALSKGEVKTNEQFETPADATKIADEIAKEIAEEVSGEDVDTALTELESETTDDAVTELIELQTEVGTLEPEGLDKAIDLDIVSEESATTESETLSDEAIDTPKEITEDKTADKQPADKTAATYAQRQSGPQNPAAALAPFYLSAKEYLALRAGKGDSDLETLTLSYDVLTGEQAETVTLNIGADFAAIITAIDGTVQDAKIYDFKLNRILQITPDGEVFDVENPEPESSRDGALDTQRFTSSSLFASVHLDTSAVSKDTNNGKKASISLPGGQTLDAFWMESAMGWAQNDRMIDIASQTDAGLTTVDYKGDPVFSVSFDDAPYPDLAMSDAMLIFAHHQFPLHPSLAKNFYAAPAPIKTMMIKSVSPRFPDGQVQTWTLTNRETANAPFPLAQDTAGIFDGPAIDPLAFIIREAADNQARGGLPKLDEIEDEINSALDAGEITTAWLAGQRYIAHAGKCRPAICTQLETIEKLPDLSAELTTLVAAFKDSQSPDTRVRAVKALMPWMDKEDAPAAILRTLAITRAKIRKSTAVAAQVDTINVESLLIEALAKDPYDPQIYIGLAQYYAANGNIQASWDIHDALRVVIPERENVPQTINIVEDRLRERAPGFFLISSQ